MLPVAYMAAGSFVFFGPYCARAGVSASVPLTILGEIRIPQTQGDEHGEVASAHVCYATV